MSCRAMSAHDGNSIETNAMNSERFQITATHCKSRHIGINMCEDSNQIKRKYSLDPESQSQPITCMSLDILSAVKISKSAIPFSLPLATSGSLCNHTLSSNMHEPWCFQRCENLEIRNQKSLSLSLSLSLFLPRQPPWLLPRFSLESKPPPAPPQILLGI